MLSSQVPTQMTAEQLRPTFEPFGNIEEVSIIHDKSTQMSKGCGFVTFSTEEAARAAIEALSEKLVLVRLLTPGSSRRSPDNLLSCLMVLARACVIRMASLWWSSSPKDFVSAWSTSCT